MTSSSHNELESEENSDSVDDNDNDNSKGEGMLKPSVDYENECDDIVDDVYSAISELLGALTESVWQQGCELVKKVTAFTSTILKSNQKWAALEEACVHHSKKPLKLIKVVRTHWNSHCDAFEHHLDPIPSENVSGTENFCLQIPCL